MSRRSQAAKRETPADAKYNNVIVTQLINKIMKDGKKSTAEKIVYGAMSTIEGRESTAPLTVLSQAVRNATPQLQVKSRRIGGATYQVPVEIRPERSLSLAIRWLVAAARARQGRSMIEKLAGELSDASHGQGATVKKRDDTHRMAEANRAFAHYRW
ncbi:MAG: 30S ribosomal protein S7 [Dehalococcoidales bacterium]|jgi:small subunit ribosomal protein S7|nr:30S ribosomal protein S7 [Dehalococcoidales bacterium]MDP6501317.1 30S ribosomal protein S7 [Dehalococcoidales bacterium]MDP6632545.1 30S ribosomal protein S7 [Dehalococcoidales bacterium]